jgi:hypothetical protein
MKFYKMNSCVNECFGVAIARSLTLPFAALLALPVALWVTDAPSAQAATLWNEATNGDLSDQGTSPTQLGSLTPGSNLLTASFNAGTANPSPDYFTLEVPDGLVLKNIALLDWKSEPSFEDIAFFAVQSGNVFDFKVPADRSNANGLLGWTHLRSTQVNSSKVLSELARSNQSPADSGVAADYEAEAKTYSPELLAQFPDLPDKLRALSNQWVPGAEGFEEPLGAGQYTFWLRQGSDTNITAAFDFKTVAADDAVSTPEPFSLLALGVISGAGLLLSRQQRRL